MTGKEFQLRGSPLRYRRTTVSGSALAEFVLVIPILLLSGFGLYDCYHSYHVQQILSNVVRELGNAAYRYCPDMPAGADMNKCLQDISNDVLSHTNGADGVLPGTEVVVSVYRYNTATPSTPIRDGTYQSGTKATKFDNTAIAGTGGLRSYSADKGTVLIAEAFASRTALLPFFPNGLYQKAIY